MSASYFTALRSDSGKTPNDFNELVDSARTWSDGASPEQILIWAVENFHPRLAVSCSFGNCPGRTPVNDDLRQRLLFDRWAGLLRRLA